MDLFTKLFGDFLVFVYHCFDRIVIHGYLTALSRPELVVHFFREIVGVAEVSKEALSQRTADYQNWVEAYASNHAIPIEWAEKGVRKEDHVPPWLRRMAKRNAYGVYFIFKSMEQGPTFRISLPKDPAKDPHYRIVAHQRSRFTHYDFYVRDEALGPMVVRVASFFPFQTTDYLNGHSFIEQELRRAGIGFRKDDSAFLAVDDVAALQASADRLSPEIIRRRLDYWTLILGPKFSRKERARLNLSRFYAISQIEYCRNFIFKRHFPIHKLFERSCELGLWRLSADKIATIFSKRVSRRMHGKLATVIDQIEHGHHVFRAYFKSGFLKQYEKFRTFLRNELVSSNLTDFGLRKGLDNLDAVRTTPRRSRIASPASRPSGSTCMSISRCCSASPIRSRSARCVIPASRSTRRASSACSRFSSTATPRSAAGRPGKSTTPSSPPLISQRRLTASTSCAMTCVKGRGLIERDGSRYADRLTQKGVQVALLFLFFHKAPLRAARQQPLPSPARPAAPPQQPARSRLSPRRRRVRLVLSMIPQVRI